MNTSTHTSLRITREIGAPRDIVYAAWIDTGTALKWWGPKGVQTEELVIEAHVGGKLRWQFRTPEGERITAMGEFREVSPEEKLVLAWSGTQDVMEGAEESVVTVEFRAKAPGTTELVLTHENLPSEKSRDNHAEGWNSALDKLEHFLAS